VTSATIGVKEAAKRLGLSAQEVRARCRAGALPGFKIRNRWLLDVAAVDQIIQSESLPGLTREVLSRALEHIEALDLREEWLPDILRHKDQLTDRESILSDAESRLRTRSFGGTHEVDVPKTVYFSRAGKLLSLEDRVAFHAAVALFARTVEDALLPTVYSARLARPGTRYFTKRAVIQWRKWSRAARRSLRRSGPWLAKTDLVSYFDTIRFDLLDGELQSLGVDQRLRSVLLAMLQAWSPIPGSGLIQGPDAARVLGNLYLAPVDAVMSTTGTQYFRYMDDIRIIGRSRRDVIHALRILERECRWRGLILSPTKTSLHSGKEARDLERDDRRDIAQYIFQVGDFEEAQRALSHLLRDSLTDPLKPNLRNSEFSLWRLSQLQDSSMVSEVFNALDDLTPKASVLAEYLYGQLGRPETDEQITEYLTDPSSLRHPHLMFHLFALMLEHPRPLPREWLELANEWMRDEGSTSQLRGIAANLVALQASPLDLAYLRREIRSSSDLYLARSYLTALARGGCLDRATLTTALHRGPLLARAATYLSTATDLPSLVSTKRVVPIG